MSFIFLQAKGLEEGGIAVRRGKKHAGDMFFSPGESPNEQDGIPQGCWLAHFLNATPQNFEMP